MENNENVELLNEEVKPEEKEEVKVEIPKKKSPIGLIILIIILMSGCLVGGYFINESGILSGKKDEPEKKEKETKKEKKNPVVTNYAVTDEKVVHLIDNLLNFGRVPSCGLIELLANDKKIQSKDIDNNMAWGIIVNNEEFDDDSISLDDVNKTIQKYLGKDYKFDPHSVNTNICGSNYEYNESAKKFDKKPIPTVGGCGGACAVASSSYRMVKAVDTDGILKIDVKVIFDCEGIENCDGFTYFSDYARTNLIGNYNLNRIEELYEKGSDYQFTFKLEDGNYVFVSSEPVK